MVIRRAGYFFGPSARRTGANLRIWVAQAAQPDRPIPVRMTQFVRISESPERLEGRARGGLRCSPPPARSVPPTRRPGAARSSTVTARPAPSMRAAATSIQAPRSSTAPTSVPWPPTRTHQPRLIHRCRHPTHRTHPRIRQPTGPELGPQQRQPHQRVRHPNIHTSRRTTQPHMTHQPMPSTGIPPHPRPPTIILSHQPQPSTRHRRDRRRHPRNLRLQTWSPPRRATHPHPNHRLDSYEQAYEEGLDNSEQA